MSTQVIFEKFLEDTVNLNKARVDRAKDAERVLSSFIKNHEDFKDLYVGTSRQGSFRQKTIIKPVDDDAKFDVDLLIKLKENPDWSPADYHAKLAQAFKDSGRYEDLTDTDGKTRCVTIDYEGDFHVDLVPVVERDGKCYVCNKTTDQFEETDGDGYAKWFESQDTLAGGQLVPAVRLLKYLRDSKGEFHTKSIILTTIAGASIQPADNFSTLPELYTAMVTRMSQYLSQFESAPSIQNPAMPGETFDRHWTDDSAGFNKLKAALKIYSDMASAALSSGSDESITQWGKLFGDDFPDNDESDKGSSASVSTAAAASLGGGAARSFTPRSPYADQQ